MIHDCNPHDSFSFYFEGPNAYNGAERVSKKKLKESSGTTDLKPSGRQSTPYMYLKHSCGAQKVVDEDCAKAQHTTSATRLAFVTCEHADRLA